MNRKMLATLMVLAFLAVGTMGAVKMTDKGKTNPDKTEKVYSNTPEVKQEQAKEPIREPEQKQKQEQKLQDPDAEKKKLEAAFLEEKSKFNLLLANVDNPLPADFTTEVEEVQNSFKMDSRVAPIARSMIEDAKTAGVDLLVCSAYRSVEKQTSLFDEEKQIYLDAGKTEEEAIALTATAIAIPGTSEHQSGLSTDIVTPSYQTLDKGFANTDAFRWLDANAWKYGFILRFPEGKEEKTKIMYESWHYRYVGLPHAKLIKDSGLCLEEYLAQSLPEGFTGEDFSMDSPANITPPATAETKPQG